LPDPQIEPIQLRWWDGSEWTATTHRSRRYGSVWPVKVHGRARFWSSFWNFLMTVLVLEVLIVGTMFLMRHFAFRIGDPTAVYVPQLGSVEKPKIVIASACPASVLRVKHYQGYLNRSFNQQQWSVIPVPGHVSVAYFNVDSGQVTCP
jgi:hypothetical protein